MEDFNKNLLRICPVCGFSFRASDLDLKTQKVQCPMCGYEFSDPNLPPQHNKKRDWKFY